MDRAHLLHRAEPRVAHKGFDALRIVDPSPARPPCDALTAGNACRFWRSAARRRFFTTAGICARGTIATYSTIPLELRDDTPDGLLVDGLEVRAVRDMTNPGWSVGWVQPKRYPSQLEP